MNDNRYHHVSWLEGIDLFEAGFSDLSFSRHSHEGFAIGAISHGVGGYFCRGENMVLPTGSLSLMNPEEAHTGQAHSPYLRYNMLYVTEDAVRRCLGLKHLPGFREVTPQDHGHQLSRSLALLAQSLNGPKHAGLRLQVEECIAESLAIAFETHGRAAVRPAGWEPEAIRTVRAVIRDEVTTGADLSLSELAGIAGLSPGYLVRSFARAYGMTPHAWLLQCRVNVARDHLLAGASGAEAALEAGFCDQSHMIRQMRRFLGVTPKGIRVH
ncbi:MAG: AraC family transcriptional regulator [Gammaproteobacteria bacterium]|nr:MAG: AraC family transcriptional regulator [Gammaproteobacteria bacterium]